MEFVKQHLGEAAEILGRFDLDAIERLATLLAELRERGGRLFFLGVGGSAANCSHAVNDFRKIAGIEAYAPTDNVSELTARTNDEGWASVFVEWLKVQPRCGRRHAASSSPSAAATSERNVSPNLVSALQHAKSVGAQIAGIVGRDGGYTAQRRRRLRHRPDRQRAERHAARRGVPGRDLAPARVPSAAQGGPDEVGVDAMTTRRLPRPRRRAEPRRACATASRYPPADARRDRRSSPAPPTRCAACASAASASSSSPTSPTWPAARSSAAPSRR